MKEKIRLSPKRRTCRCKVRGSRFEENCFCRGAPVCAPTLA
jgi:hypothetical protein